MLFTSMALKVPCLCCVKERIVRIWLALLSCNMLHMPVLVGAATEEGTDKHTVHPGPHRQAMNRDCSSLTRSLRCSICTPQPTLRTRRFSASAALAPCCCAMLARSDMSLCRALRSALICRWSYRFGLGHPWLVLPTWLAVGHLGVREAQPQSQSRHSVSTYTMRSLPLRAPEQAYCDLKSRLCRHLQDRTRVARINALPALWIALESVRG